MGKNRFGGNRAKRMKNKNFSKQKRELVTKDTNQYYAYVNKRLGSNRLSVYTDDGEEIQAIIPGKFMRRVYMREKDIVLVEKCEYAEMYHIVLKYSDDEARKLKKLKVLGKIIEFSSSKESMDDSHYEKTKNAFTFVDGKIDEEEDDDLDVKDFYKNLKTTNIKKEKKEEEEIINIDDI